MVSWIYKIRSEQRGGEPPNIQTMQILNRGCPYMWVDYRDGNRLNSLMDATDLYRNRLLGSIATSDLAYYYRYVGDDGGGLSMFNTPQESLAVAYLLYEHGNPAWMEAWTFMHQVDADAGRLLATAGPARRNAYSALHVAYDEHQEAMEWGGGI